MSRGKAMTQLIRLRDMKVRRLAEWRGSFSGKEFLKADIAALDYAIELIDSVRRAERVEA